MSSPVLWILLGAAAVCWCGLESQAASLHVKEIIESRQQDNSQWTSEVKLEHGTEQTPVMEVEQNIVKIGGVGGQQEDDVQLTAVLSEDVSLQADSDELEPQCGTSGADSETSGTVPANWGLPCEIVDERHTTLGNQAAAEVEDAKEEVGNSVDSSASSSSSAENDVQNDGIQNDDVQNEDVQNEDVQNDDV